MDDFDELAQRLVVALRDHADATRAMPDLDAMRQMLHAAATAVAAGNASGNATGTAADEGPGAGLGGTRPSPRVLAAAACALLVLGGLGLVAGTGSPGDAASTVVADETLVAEARRLASSSTTSIEPVVVPAVTVEAEMVTTTVAPAPPTTVAPPSTTVLVVAAVSNDLQPAPTTTLPPPTTAPPTTKAPVPAPTAPKPTVVEPAPTTTAKPPKSTTTVAPTTTVSPYAFTMKQKWKTSSASPPFEEFSGTAQPGATITITSSYGGGTTVVAPSGAWALRVEFPTAPVGTAFTGKVKTAQGQKSFTFKRTSP